MSKRKAAILIIVIVLITNGLTFGLTNVIGLKTDNKIFIPVTEYEELVSVYKEFSKVMHIEEFIEEKYLRDVDKEKLMDGQLKGLLYSLEDPYSNYLTKDEFALLLEETSGSFGGIGVMISPGDDNLITVVSPIEDTPGERAGIKSGDKIIKVNGKDFFAEDMDLAVKEMKGEPDTDVVLTIMRVQKGKENEIFDLEITREIIRVVSVKSEVIDDNIGYIRISNFDDLTYKDFKDHLDQLGKDKIEGLIIDLRNNPGGLLSRTVEIADELLGEGDIVYTQTKDGNREYKRSNKKMVDYPLAILVNGGSASASEILAGAVKDHNRGVLIGTKTFGKGVVQQLHRLNDGSGVRLTISEYFTPNGINIHGIGIEPDIEVELDESVEIIGIENIEGDNQLQRAIKEIKSKIK